MARPLLGPDPVTARKPRNYHRHPKVRPKPKPTHPWARGLRLSTGEVRWYTDAWLRHRMGTSKGGQTTASRPNPGRFTSETARAAINKAWRTRWRFNKRIGKRLGYPAKRLRPCLDHGALRAFYAKYPLHGIRYDPVEQRWLLTLSLTGPGSFPRTISERAALRRLGHLAKDGVPFSILIQHALEYARATEKA